MELARVLKEGITSVGAAVIQPVALKQIAALLAAAERSALSAGKTLLVLDTDTGSDAERLYARQGWQRCGQIPSYALWPEGKPCATTIFFKFLRN